MGRYIKISQYIADIDITGVVLYWHFNIISVTSEILVVYRYYFILFQTF